MTIQSTTIFEGFIRLMGTSHMLSIASTQCFLGVLIIYTIYKGYKKGYTWSDFPYTYYFAVLAVLTTISIFAGVDTKRSMRSLFDWWLYFYFIGMFLMARKKDVLPTVILFVVIGADIASVFGLYQYFIRGDARAEGFFTHALTYGNTLTMCICLVLACIVTRSYRRRSELVFFCTSCLLMSTALLVSVTRGPMLATIATLCIMAVLFYRLKGVVAGAVLIAVLVGIIAAVPNLRVRYVEFVDNSWTNENTAMGVRIPLWKASLEIIRDYPLFGIGERNFRQMAKKYIGRSLHTMAHAHNAYLHYALTHGLIAFGVLVALIVKLLYDTLPGAVRRQPVAFMAVSVLTVFLLESLTENTIGDSEVVMLFYYLMGTLTGTLYRTGEPT